LRKIKLNKEKIYLGSCFQRFQSMVTWLHWCDPWARQGIVVRMAWQNKAALFVADRKQRRGKGARVPLTSLRACHNNLLPPTRPTSSTSNSTTRS
jgi:hypothetical protein